jgi:hypothetical protein
MNRLATIEFGHHEHKEQDMQNNPPKSESATLNERAGATARQVQPQSPAEKSCYDDTSSAAGAAKQVGRPPLNHRR